jgi:hypothetical protein
VPNPPQEKAEMALMTREGLQLHASFQLDCLMARWLWNASTVTLEENLHEL